MNIKEMFYNAGFPFYEENNGIVRVSDAIDKRHIGLG